jgi:hypothetical protein
MSIVPLTNQFAWQPPDPSWLEAIATCVAAVAAIVALVAAFRAGAYTKKLLAIEDGREERALRESEGRQAFTVDAWEERLPPEAFGHVGTLVVRLVNGSKVAVYDVRIDWYDHTETTWRAGVGLPILKPGHEDVPVPSELAWPEVNGIQELSVEPISQWPFLVTFRDRAGLYWTRGFDGALARHEAKPTTGEQEEAI